MNSANGCQSAQKMKQREGGATSCTADYHTVTCDNESFPPACCSLAGEWCVVVSRAWSKLFQWDTHQPAIQPLLFFMSQRAHKRDNETVV